MFALWVRVYLHMPRGPCVDTVAYSMQKLIESMSDCMVLGFWVVICPGGGIKGATSVHVHACLILAHRRYWFDASKRLKLVPCKAVWRDALLL